MANPFKKTNILKTLRYLKKNGAKNTFYALTERLFYPYYKDYTYIAPSQEELGEERKAAGEGALKFSIVVPCYETKPEYLEAMIQSVLNQTYANFELILADASASRQVQQKAEKLIQNNKELRIKYIRLEENKGISENTNAGILAATGDYVGLLDHDDLLTKDALYQIALQIRKEKNEGNDAILIYSDEDKCNEDATIFYDPHFKPDFNQELLYTNNYICHFSVIKTDVIKKILFRKEYDGAQDFDLMLRISDYVRTYGRADKEARDITQSLTQGAVISHIPKVLYHWRCHMNSTAENPESKMYAYEAGRRAVQDAYTRNHIHAEVIHSKNLGFYESVYGTTEKFFEERTDVGCIGGAVYAKGQRLSGCIDEDGVCTYKGLNKHFDGYMHRAVLRQNAYAVDIRNIVVRKELQALFKETTGYSYISKQGEQRFDAGILPKDADFVGLSVKFAKKIKAAGYTLIYQER